MIHVDKMIGTNTYLADGVIGLVYFSIWFK